MGELVWGLHLVRKELSLLPGSEWFFVSVVWGLAWSQFVICEACVGGGYITTVTEALLLKALSQPVIREEPN